MTNKFIIHNDSSLSDTQAVYYVSRVVDGGLVSSTRGVEHYCHVTKFEHVIVYCTMNSENSFTFRITEDAKT